MRTVAGYHTPEVDAVTTEAPGNSCGMHEENPVDAHLVWLEEQKRTGTVATYVPAGPTGTQPQPTTALRRIIDHVRENAHSGAREIRSAPSVCGGGVDSSAAHAGSEVVRRRAALEHEYELQQAQMEIARLSAALKLSEAANDGLRDDNNKLRMLLYKRTAGARDAETNANTLVQPSRKKRKVAYSAHQTKMLEELYFEGKLESREGRAAAVVSVSGLSTPDGLVVGRLVTIADIVNWRHNYIKFLKANAKADQA